MGRRTPGRARRSGGGGGGGGSGGGQSARPPLPSTVYEYFHSEIGASSATAVGVLQGTTLNGINTPVVAPDGTNFNGKQVYQASIASSRHWRASGLVTGIASGTWPYYAGTARTRTLETVAGLNRCLWTAGGGTGAGEEQQRMGLQSNGAGLDGFEWIRRHNSGNIVITSGDVQDTNVHFFELVLDNTLGMRLFMDGTLLVGSAAGGATDALTTGVDFAGIGSLGLGTANLADVSLAFWIWCTATPTLGERAALLSYSRSYWGSTP